MPTWHDWHWEPPLGLSWCLGRWVPGLCPSYFFRWETNSVHCLSRSEFLQHLSKEDRVHTVGSSLLSEHGRGFKQVDRSRDQHLTASSMKREGCGDHFNFNFHFNSDVRQTSEWSLKGSLRQNWEPAPIVKRNANKFVSLATALSHLVRCVLMPRLCPSLCNSDRTAWVWILELLSREVCSCWHLSPVTSGYSCAVGDLNTVGRLITSFHGLYSLKPMKD